MPKFKKEIMLVYQDCPMCGSREDWGKKQTEIANRHHFKIIETPFYKTGVAGLIMRAIQAGCNHLPFFTDGSKFSYSLDDFVDKKPVKKNKTKKERK